MYNSRVTSCVNITNNGFGSFCINFSSLSGREEGIHCTRVMTRICLLPSVEGTSLAVCCAPYRQQTSSLVPALKTQMYSCLYEAKQDAQLSQRDHAAGCVISFRQK